MLTFRLTGQKETTKGLVNDWADWLTDETVVVMMIYKPRLSYRARWAAFFISNNTKKNANRGLVDDEKTVSQRARTREGGWGPMTMADVSSLAPS